MFLQQAVKEAEDVVLRSYKEYLTGEAFKFILTEYERHEALDVERTSSYMYINSNSGQYQFTLTSCTCGFISSVMLPCRHIFCARKLAEISLFSKKLCHERWTKDYYRKHQRVFRSETLQNCTDNQPKISKTVNLHPVTEKEIKNKLTIVINHLIHFGKLSEGLKFQNKLETINRLFAIWKNGSFCIIEEEKQVSI